MKPIILVEKNGKVILSKEDLQNIIEDVYEEGKKDGRNSNSHYCNWYFCPYRNRNTWDWTKVTCKTTTDTTDPTIATVNPIYTTDTVGYVPLNAVTSDSSCKNKCKTTIRWANKENK